jgi:hypothetical protein
MIWRGALGLLVLLAAGEARAAAPACPAVTFTGFLEVFLSSPEMQKRFTADPLVTSYIKVQDVPDPETMVQRERGAQLKFPLAPSRGRQRAEGLEIDVRGAASARPVVVIAKPDTDYVLRFTFERTNCWRLIRYDDESL